MIYDAFEFETNDDVADQHIVSFNMNVTDNAGGNWSSVFNITLNAPEIAVGAVSFTDVSGGNGDGIIDPGETIELTIVCENNGHSDAPATTAVLSSNSPYCNIANPNIALGTISASNSSDAVYTISVDALTPLGSALDFNFSVGSGKYTAQNDFILKVGIIGDDFETGDFLKFPWVTAGNKNWFVSTNDPYEGAYCAESGDIGGNQLSIMMITMDVIVDDSISFFRKVSSEQDYDFLSFSIDNQVQGYWSGELGWERVAYPVTTGVHSFKWAYEKDFWASQGDDCGWIDFVVFPPISISSSTDDIYSNNDLNFNVYPNPFTNKIRVRFNAPQGDYSIRLLNALGQVVKAFSNQNIKSDSTGELLIDMEDIKSGVYYIRLESGENNIVRKLIKS
jgi:hypothetical protein